MLNSNCAQAVCGLIVRSGAFRLPDMIYLVGTKVLSNQRLYREKMPIREVLEVPFAVESGFRHGCERLDCAQEVIVVIHQLEFDRSCEGGVARQHCRSLGLVDACFDKCLETEALQSLRGGAPVLTKEETKGSSSFL